MPNARRVLSVTLLAALIATSQAVLNGGSCSAATGLTCPEKNPCCSGQLGFFLKYETIAKSC